MKATSTAVTLPLGGAICGSLVGAFGGALLGTVYGLVQGNVSFGLDGALLGGAITATCGTVYGAVLWVLERRPGPKPGGEEAEEAGTEPNQEQTAAAFAARGPRPSCHRH